MAGGLRGRMPADCSPFRVPRAAVAHAGSRSRRDKMSADSMDKGTRSTALDILRQLCPRCRAGKIFDRSVFFGFPKMYERCPVCDLKFEREPGYFLGAMYFSYGLGLVIIALIAALLWYVTGWWITKDTIWALVLFLPFAPTITLFARVLWIYLDQTIDPERRP